MVKQINSHSRIYVFETKKGSKVKQEGTAAAVSKGE